MICSHLSKTIAYFNPLVALSFARAPAAAPPRRAAAGLRCSGLGFRIPDAGFWDLGFRV